MDDTVQIAVEQFDAKIISIEKQLECANKYHTANMRLTESPATEIKKRSIIDSDLVTLSACAMPLILERSDREKEKWKSYNETDIFFYRN